MASNFEILFLIFLCVFLSTYIIGGTELSSQSIQREKSLITLFNEDNYHLDNNNNNNNNNNHRKRRSRACEPITIPACRSIGYNYTIYPNTLHDRSQAEASLRFAGFENLLKYGCSEKLTLLLCSIFVPICGDEVRKYQEYGSPPITVCRHVCERAQAGCEWIMAEFGFGWPDYLECSRFPRDGICMNDDNKNFDKNAFKQISTAATAKTTLSPSSPLSSSSVSIFESKFSKNNNDNNIREKLRLLNQRVQQQQQQDNGKNSIISPHSSSSSSSSLSSFDFDTKIINDNHENEHDHKDYDIINYYYYSPYAYQRDHRSESGSNVCVEPFYREIAANYTNLFSANQNLKCAPVCDRAPPYSASTQKQIVRVTIIVAVACALISLVAICTFLLDPDRFPYPHRALIYLLICGSICAIFGYLLATIFGASLRFACVGPYLLIGIYSSSSSSFSASWLACVSNLIAFYCFGTIATANWWTIWTATWFAATAGGWSHESIGEYWRYYHLYAWLAAILPSIVIIRFAANDQNITDPLDGDPLLGACVIGAQNPTNQMIFVLLPTGIIVLVATILSVINIVALFRIFRSISAIGNKAIFVRLPSPSESSSPSSSLSTSGLPNNPQRSLRRLLIKLTLLSTFLIVANIAVLACNLIDYWNKRKYLFNQSKTFSISASESSSSSSFVVNHFPTYIKHHIQLSIPMIIALSICFTRRTAQTWAKFCRDKISISIRQRTKMKFFKNYIKNQNSNISNIPNMTNVFAQTLLPPNNANNNNNNNNTRNYEGVRRAISLSNYVSLMPPDEADQEDLQLSLSSTSSQDDPRVNQNEPKMQPKFISPQFEKQQQQQQQLRTISKASKYYHSLPNDSRQIDLTAVECAKYRTNSISSSIACKRFYESQV